MIMHEFGKNNKDTILLLHGACCSYKMWTPQITELQKEYHLFVPSMSGHEPSDIDFISSRDEAEIITVWFRNRNISSITIICGVSLGAHVAAEMIQKHPKFVKYAMLESLKSYQYKGILFKLFSVMGKKMLKKFPSTKGCMAGTYGQQYASDDSKYTISHMSDKSLDNVMTECTYKVEDLEQKIKSITMIIYGQKEKKICILNTNILKKQIENCEVIEIPMYNHGELVIGHPDEHLKYLKKLLQSN